MAVQGIEGMSGASFDRMGVAVLDVMFKIAWDRAIRAMRCMVVGLGGLFLNFSGSFPRAPRGVDQASRSCS